MPIKESITLPAVLTETMKNNFFREFAISLAFFVLLTVPFLVWDIDVAFQKMLYKDGEWVFKNHALWVFCTITALLRR